jgi:hypothetical protein
VGELVRAVGARRAPKLVEHVDAARRAFERDRYTEARSLIAPVAKEAPGAAAVRELHGLTLYRLERYKAAAVELEAYATITGEVDEHPVLADCHRAMKHYDRVAELWTELREVSPSAELVTEGRIVAAGALADRGELEAEGEGAHPSPARVVRACRSGRPGRRRAAGPTDLRAHRRARRRVRRRVRSPPRPRDLINRRIR